MLTMENCGRTFNVEQKAVTDGGVLIFRVVMSVRSFPSDFISEVLRAENGIQQNLKVCRRCRVAVQIQAAGGLQDAVQMPQARSHHHQVRRHVVMP